MFPRAARVILALAWFVFVGIVVPGHTRGMITLGARPPGAAAVAAPTAACCEAPAPTRGESKHAPANPVPGNCAVCSAAAKLSTPPPLLTSLAFLGLSPVGPPVETVEHPPIAQLAAPSCRGPPGS